MVDGLKTLGNFYVMDASFVLKIALVADNPGAVQERAPVYECLFFFGFNYNAWRQ
jgi:hypothetical protein